MMNGLKAPKKQEAWLYVRGIDPMIKARFKAWCAERNLSMTYVIEQFMADKLEQSSNDTRSVTKPIKRRSPRKRS